MPRFGDSGVGIHLLFWAKGYGAQPNDSSHNFDLCSTWKFSSFYHADEFVRLEGWRINQRPGLHTQD